MNCKDLHKTILGLLDDPQVSYRPILLSLLYNLLFKNASALKLYRRPEVVSLIISIRAEQDDEEERSPSESVSELCSALGSILSMD